MKVRIDAVIGLTCWLAGAGCTNGVIGGGPDAHSPDAARSDAATDGAAAPDAPPAGSIDGIIPAQRLADWTTAGVPGGIRANRTHVIDVTRPPYNADNTGATSASAAIQAAVDAAMDDCVVYLPAGRYLIDRTILIGAVNPGRDKDNITLRGAGMDRTTLDCRAGRCIEVGSEADYRWDAPAGGNAITAGLAHGSTQLTVADTSAFEVGRIAQIAFADDPSLPVVSVAGFGFNRRQKTRITGRTATTLTISPPVLGNVGALAARINVAAYQSDFVGIEDLTVDGSMGMPQFGIMFTQTFGSWIKNVRVNRAANYSVYFTDSLHCEMRGSYLDELNHTGSNGAGLLMGATGSCLIEDNVIYKSFPHIEVNSGSTGNVFAYNFLEQNDAGGLMGMSIDSNHAPHNAHNLFEGNVASVFQSDGYFGSDSDETLFRNWLHGTCDTTNQFGRAVHLSRFSRNFSVVGNVLGRTGFAFRYDNARGGTGYAERYAYILGLPNIGNGGFNGRFAQLSMGMPWADWGGMPGPGGFQELDLDVEATTIRRGNWNAADGAVPASESLGGATLPASLYLRARPPWFRSLAWPPFDATRPNQRYDAIPAGYRYVHRMDPP